MFRYNNDIKFLEYQWTSTYLFSSRIYKRKAVLSAFWTTQSLKAYTWSYSTKRRILCHYKNLPLFAQPRSSWMIRNKLFRIPLYRTNIKQLKLSLQKNSWLKVFRHIVMKKQSLLKIFETFINNFFIAHKCLIIS